MPVTESPAIGPGPIGRDAESAILAAALEVDRPVVAVGEPGIGKTTLLRWAAAASGRQLFEGGALATLSWMVNLPLQRALGEPVTGDTVLVQDQVEAAVGSGILLLDDLQWADPSTVEVVIALVGRIGLLTAVRRGDPASGPVLSRLAAAGFLELPVGGLDAAACSELVRAVRPDASPTLVRSLQERTGGNPLLLGEIASAGTATASLRMAMSARLRQLDVPGRHGFGLLAVAGRPLPAAVLGRPAVKGLLEADLVRVDGESIGVRHSMLAEMALEDFAADEIRELHHTLADQLTAPGERARHLAGAGRPGEALVAAVAAADESEVLGERAENLALAATCAAGPTADALLLRAAQALGDADDWPRMVAVLERITGTDPAVRAEALLLRARSAWSAGDAGGLAAALREGLELVAGTGSAAEVKLRIEYCRVPIFVETDVDRSITVSRGAVELADRTGIERARARYFYGTALAVADVPGWEDTLTEAIGMARAAADTQTELLAANNLISAHESSGSPAKARILTHDMVARCRELGVGRWEQGFRVNLMNLDMHAGRGALVLEEGEALNMATLDARAADVVLESTCLVLVDLGRFDEARHRLAAAPADDGNELGAVIREWVAAEIDLWDGRPGRAAEHAAAFLDRIPPGNPNRVFGQVTRAWALFDQGCDPGPAIEAQARPMLFGSPLETQGLRLAQLGDHQTAAGLFDRAAAYWAPYHRRGELRCAWAAAESVRRSGRTEQAVDRLETIEAIADELDFIPLGNRVRRSLRAAGSRRSAPRAGSRTGLTGREQEILELVAIGLSNPQIAGRLGISRHTVVTLTGSACAKLGAATRAQAAAMVVKT